MLPGEKDVDIKIRVYETPTIYTTIKKKTLFVYVFYA